MNKSYRRFLRKCVSVEPRAENPWSSCTKARFPIG